MTLTFRVRLLLLSLACLLATGAAALWIFDRSVAAERDAQERLLRHTSLALAMVLEPAPGTSAADGLGADARRRVTTFSQSALQGLQGWVEISAAGELLFSTGPGGNKPSVQPMGPFEMLSPQGELILGYSLVSQHGLTFTSVMPRARYGGYRSPALLRGALGGAVLVALGALGVAVAAWLARSLLRDAAGPAPGADSSPRLVALGRMAGGLAHDFNNLLGVISNCAHLVQRHACGNTALAAPVAATLRAVAAGSRLTRHLARLTEARAPQPQVLDLRRFLPGLQEILDSVVGSRITVHMAVDRATPGVLADAHELELALINLALNARDALVAGGTVWLRAQPASASDAAGRPGERLVMISVASKGSGTLSDRQSEGRAGSPAVSLLLPAADLSEAPCAPSSAPSAAAPACFAAAQSGGSAAVPLLGMRVLLVEDNPALGEVTAALLQAHGAQVQRVPDAARALERLGRGALPDVVLSDIAMPGALDGVALARQIRISDRPLPVVLISGFTGSAAPRGEFLTLDKPCSPAALVLALRQAVDSAP